MNIKDLVAKRMQRVVKFMGEDIKISKLSVEEVMKIQEKAKETEGQETQAHGFDILKSVIRWSVEGAADLTDTDFDKFPMDELSKLSTEIMKFSGLGDPAGKAA